MAAMLRVAVPNKGALSEPAAEILSEAGYRRRSDPKDLTVIDPANGMEAVREVSPRFPRFFSWRPAIAKCLAGGCLLHGMPRPGRNALLATSLIAFVFHSGCL